MDKVYHSDTQPLRIASIVDWQRVAVTLLNHLISNKFESKSSLARLLGVHRQTISKWMGESK